MKHKLLLIGLLLFSFTQITFPQGFLHTDGKQIVKGNGEPIILRGMGLGGWMVQEGYMLQTSGFANAQHQIRAKIEDLIGTTNTDLFYEEYLANYVKRADIDSLAKWGFNSIRLPMHYNLFTPLGQPGVFIEKGFEMVDSLLQWCKDNQMYLILDLHAAPGGQSDEPISDYNSSLPSLWEDTTNQNSTVELWREIATRYVDEEWIGGYDLINEPKWDVGPNNLLLRQLYGRITNAIRTVDTNHIVFIEGNWFATDFAGLTPPWDDNLVYSFHKYWNANDQGAIQYLLNIGITYDVPLWLGESGENSNSWFVDCIELIEPFDIGWAWWPHKKIDAIAGPVSAEKTAQYQVLLDYWNGQGSKPSAAYATTALMLQASKLSIDQCRIQYDVIDALSRQIFNTETIPYKQHNIPGRIYMVDFDMGQRGYAYDDSDHHNTGGGSYNNGWAYRNEGVDIEGCEDVNTNGYNVGWTATGEWLQFTTTIDQDAAYDILLRITANEDGGKVKLQLDGVNITSFIDVPNTGGWQNWQTVRVDSIILPAGEHKLRIDFYFGGFNINYVEFQTNTVGVDDEVKTRIESFELKQNYPNPFNPSTTITYSLPNDANVSLKVYDIMGREIAVLTDEFQSAGVKSVNWDGRNTNGSAVANGVYLYKITASSPDDKTVNFTDHKKMLLLK